MVYFSTNQAKAFGDTPQALEKMHSYQRLLLTLCPLLALQNKCTQWCQQGFIRNVVLVLRKAKNTRGVTYSRSSFLDKSLIFCVASTLFPTGEVLRLGRISGHTVNGGWSSWSSWSQCSRDCSRGIRSRKRTCSNPEPKYGGQTCLGPAQEYQECNITPCPGKKCTHATS